MGEHNTEKTGSTYNSEIEIKHGSSTIQFLNAIENSTNITTISYSSLYGFVFRVKLAEQNTTNSIFTIQNSHNKTGLSPNNVKPTHIVLKFTVLVNGDRKSLENCVNVYTHEKYTKHTNTVNEFTEEVNNQNAIYSGTLGPNGIAICPKIFYDSIYENMDAIEFLEFFDKNVSDIECTYLANYLLFTLRNHGNYKLGLIAMEYIQLGDVDNSDAIRFIRNDRIALYDVLTTPKKIPFKKGYDIVDKLINILPTLRITPDILYKKDDNIVKETRRSKNSPIDTTINSNLNNIIQTNNAKLNENENQELEYLRLNYYKYRIIAHVIYYMLKAYKLGYVHKDLHSRNIFVVDPYIKYHGCLHPFSLNDVGIGQNNINIQMYQREYFTGEPVTVVLNCGNIQNYCNLSCIQIIDWGRTSKEVEQTSPSSEIITIDHIIEMINNLKNKYPERFYIFNVVGLNDELVKNSLSYSQFYIVWLIWNEFYLMDIFVKSQSPKEPVPEEEKQGENKTNDFYEFLTLFKTNCEYNAFYETIEY
jgi:hypothetical protein